MKQIMEAMETSKTSKKAFLSAGTTSVTAITWEPHAVASASSERYKIRAQIEPRQQARERRTASLALLLQRKHTKVEHVLTTNRDVAWQKVAGTNNEERLDLSGSTRWRGESVGRHAEDQEALLDCRKKIERWHGQDRTLLCHQTTQRWTKNKRVLTKRTKLWSNGQQGNSERRVPWSTYTVS